MSKKRLLTIIQIGTVIIGGICFIILFTPKKEAKPILPTNINSPITYQEIFSKHESMTDLQFSDYINSLIGVRIHIIATVEDVESDGSIYLNVRGGDLFESMILNGVPTGTAAKINKGDLLDFIATIDSFQKVIGFSIFMTDPVIQGNP
jgi:hypothetical protein